MRSNVLRWRRFFIMMEEDSGGGGGGDGPAEQDGSEGEDKPQDELTAPGYFAQLPEEKAKSDAYKSLYRYQKLDELADALLEANGKLEGMDRAIIVPKKGDKEGVAEFAKKLGVPDEPSGYKMEALSDISKDQPELVEAIRKGCRRMLFTERQGEAIGEMIASVNKANAIREKLEIRNNIRHQAERVAALYKDVFPAEIDRNNAAAEDISRYESFLKETGLENLIGSSLLAGNPKMIKAISAYAKKHGGVVTPKGGSIGAGGERRNGGKTIMPMSKDWEDFVKAQAK